MPFRTGFNEQFNFAQGATNNRLSQIAQTLNIQNAGQAGQDKQAAKARIESFAATLSPEEAAEFRIDPPGFMKRRAATKATDRLSNALTVEGRPDLKNATNPSLEPTRDAALQSIREQDAQGIPANVGVVNRGEAVAAAAQVAPNQAVSGLMSGLFPKAGTTAKPPDKLAMILAWEKMTPGPAKDMLKSSIDKEGTFAPAKGQLLFNPQLQKYGFATAEGFTPVGGQLQRDVPPGYFPAAQGVAGATAVDKGIIPELGAGAGAASQPATGGQSEITTLYEKIPVPAGKSKTEARKYRDETFKESFAQERQMRSTLGMMDAMAQQATEIKAVDRDLLNRSLGYTGLAYEQLPTKEKAVRNRIEQLRQQMFGATITALRNASPTGGLVGNMSNEEGQRFTVMMANLEAVTTLDGFLQALGNVEKRASVTSANNKAAFKRLYGRDISFTGQQVITPIFSPEGQKQLTDSEGTPMYRNPSTKSGYSYEAP